METPQGVTDLIGEIYDAAIDASIWPHVLAHVRDFIEGEEATLFWKDIAGRQGGTYYDTGRMDRNYIKLYFDSYVGLDPSTTVHYFAEIDKPISLIDFADPDEFRESRFYKEWVQPQGFVDFITTAIDKSATSVAMFGVFRHERHGPACDACRTRMQLIAPHMRRAVSIGRLVDLKSAATANLTEALDGLSSAFILIDASAHIVHANASGEAMLAEGEIIAMQAGKLVVRDGDIARELASLLPGSERGDSAIGTKGIAFPMRAPGGGDYVGHLLPLVSGRRGSSSVKGSATVALVIRKAELNASPAAENIVKMFKLTNAELRVLLAIAGHGSVSETATALGISEPTVKTHLQRLFAKTGAGRQADLVMLMAKYSNPIL